MVYDKEEAHLSRTEWESVFQLQELVEEFCFTSPCFSIVIGLKFLWRSHSLHPVDFLYHLTFLISSEILSTLS